MTDTARSEREALTRAMARLGGVPYADELDDDAETLFPYRGEADTLIAEGFGRHSEVTEALVWEALEPHIETVIALDLNRYGDNEAFRQMVAAVTAVIRSGGEAEASNPGTPEATEDSAAEEIEYDYADADIRGAVMTNVMESSAYMGPVTRMRRRKAGAWEPVPTEDKEQS